MPSKALDLTAWEGHESIAFKKVKDALAQKIGDYADVVTEVEAVPEMYAFISILSIIVGQSL